MYEGLKSMLKTWGLDTVSTNPVEELKICVDMILEQGYLIKTLYDKEKDIRVKVNIAEKYDTISIVFYPDVG